MRGDTGFDPDDRIELKDIPELREKMRKAQQNVCPLCNKIIHPDQAVLDHNHETGKIRAVLHRSCNSAEGRILSLIKRTQSNNPKEFIQNLLKYWENNYNDQPYHPKHLTPVEKEIRALKRKARKLKTDRAKERYRRKIAELQEYL